MEKPKILIVDDEPDVLESTADLIESMGYIAVRVGDASQIIDTIEREKPDVILQDLKMPRLNVSGLVASLRTNPASADIPLIFFSANFDVASTAARLDAWGYLSKPFSKQELAKVLDEALGEPEATDKEAARNIHREAREIFHDFWNQIAALNNYVELLDPANEPPKDLQKTIRGIEDVLLRLESKTDRLQRYVLALAASNEAMKRAESIDHMPSRSTSPTRA